MRQSICCLIFLFFAAYAVNGQVKEFLKKEKTKYSFTRTSLTQNSKQSLRPAPFNIFAIPKPDPKPFFYYLPKGYYENQNGLLYVGSMVAGEIFRSVVAEKMNVRHPVIPEYYPYKYYLDNRR